VSKLSQLKYESDEAFLNLPHKVFPHYAKHLNWNIPLYDASSAKYEIANCYTWRIWRGWLPL